MATYKNGPMGSFSGKLGTVVATEWRDKHVLRSLPKKSSKPATQAQLLQRQKFKDAMAFLNPIAPLLTMTFKAFPSDKNGFEAAKSYHLTEAMQPNVTSWQMVYQKVLISSGNLRGLSNPSITVESNETLRLQWTDNSGQAMANASDNVVFVLYLPVLHQFEVFKEVGKREDGSADIRYAPFYVGVEAQCWASFGTFNGSKYAVSTYLGTVLL